MTVRVVVVPAAPVLLPGNSQETHPDCSPVLGACDDVLSDLVAQADEVTIVAAVDHVRDLSGRAVGDEPSMGFQVADALLDRVGFRGVRVRRTTSGPHRRTGSAWMIMADGSADVTDKSPRPGSGGGEFDMRLGEILREGDFARLADVTDSAALAVGCVTAPVWRFLAQLIPGGAACDSWAEFTPFGVRYFVGAWTTEAGTR